MKKILIINYNYPPINNIAARRFSEMIPYIEALGWQPYILTTHSKGDLNTNLPEEYIFRISEHPQSKNTQDTILVKSKKSYRHKLGLSSRIIDRSFSWYKSVISDKKLLNKLKSIKFDLILASFGPGGSLFLGNQLSKKLGVRWIVDFRDLGALYEDQFDPRNKILKFIDRFLEKKLIKTASHITTVSNGLAEELKKYYSQPVSIIYNGWDSTLKEEDTISTDTPTKLKKPYIYYAGSFYDHRLSSLFMLIESIKGIDIELRIRSLGPERINTKINAFIKKTGCEAQVKLLKPSETKVIEIEHNQSLINLIVEDLNKKFSSGKGVLTGKLMQLLLFKAPVLAIARNDSEIAYILQKSKKGVLIDNPSDLREFIKKILKQPNLYHTIDEHVETFSKKAQAISLVKIFNKQQ